MTHSLPEIVSWLQKAVLDKTLHMISGRNHEVEVHMKVFLNVWVIMGPEFHVSALPIEITHCPFLAVEHIGIAIKSED